MQFYPLIPTTLQCKSSVSSLKRTIVKVRFIWFSNGDGGEGKGWIAVWEWLWGQLRQLVIGGIGGRLRQLREIIVGWKRWVIGLWLGRYWDHRIRWSTIGINVRTEQNLTHHLHPQQHPPCMSQAPQRTNSTNLIYSVKTQN